MKFTQLDEEKKTVEAKQLAERMAHIYESVVALEWREKYEGKYALLAEIYIETTFQKRKIGDDMLTVNYFSDIVEE